MAKGLKDLQSKLEKHAKKLEIKIQSEETKRKEWEELKLWAFQR